MTAERNRMTYLNRYTLHRIDGTKTIFEARSGDVMAEDRGLRVWESRFKSRFYPFATVTEMECERVEWVAVS
jgi:hypothetical protein